MSTVDENIVREYFEGNRFLVRQLRKSEPASRKKSGDDEIQLLVFNPSFRGGERKPGFLLFSSDLPYIERALVAVKGWHASNFSPGLLKSGARLVRFLEQHVAKKVEKSAPEAEELEGMENLLRILVLPGLPTAEPFRQQAIELLQSRGVDGIISFRSMLLEIIGRVDVARSNEKTKLLELIRVLKNYDMIQNAQMELFGGKER